MVHLESVILENIACYRGTIRIDFPKSDDPKKTIYLIGALSGSGKSTLFESVKIALYGDKNKKISEIINNTQHELREPSCNIILIFDLSSNNRLIVYRSWKGQRFKEEVICGTYDKQHDKINEIIKGTKNSKDIKEFTETYLPEKISKFFFFDGEKIQEIANDENYTRFISESVQDVLGIKPYIIVRDLISKEIRAIKEHLTFIGSDDIKIVEAEISVLVKKIEGIKNKLSYLEKDKKETIAKKQKLENQLDRTTYRSIAEVKAQINSLKKEIKEIEKTIKTAIETNLAFSVLRNFEALVRNYEKLTNNVSPDFLTIDFAIQIVQSISTPSTICCNRQLNSQEIDELATRILVNLSSQNNRNGLGLQSSYLESLRKNIFIKFISKQDVLHKLKLKYNQEKELQILEGQIEKLEKLQTEYNHQAIEEDLNYLRDKINELEEDIKKKEKELSETGKDLESKKKEFNELTNNLKMDEIRRKKLAYYNKIHDIFNNYIDYLKKVRHKDLENNVKNMFLKLYRKSELITKFELTENYEIIIEENNQRILKENLAAGEKEIFALSLLWGLAKTSHLDLPIIIDTPLSRLDQDYREKIIREYFPHASHQLILLSTDSEIIPNSDFYHILEPYIAQAKTLHFDIQKKSTIVKDGYFV